MLQEKVPAVTDGCVSRVQADVEADLRTEEPRLGLSPASTTATATASASASEPDQVLTVWHKCATSSGTQQKLESAVVSSPFEGTLDQMVCSLRCVTETSALSLSLRTLRTLRWLFTSGSCGRSSMRLAPR